VKGFRESRKEDGAKEAMPEPDVPSEELLQQLAAIDMRVGELALRLREMVLREAPTASETLYSGYALALMYSLSARCSQSFCHIVVYANHVNLGFNYGAQLDDPKGELVGTGKQFRHLKVKSADDLKKPHLRKFLRAAIKHSAKTLREQERGERPAKRSASRAR